MNFGKDYLFKEVEGIKDDKIKKFVITVLDNANPEFWKAPSSSSGKYHPPEDQGERGLLRHVIKAVSVCKQYARRAVFSESETDISLAAVILHDVCKNGIEWGKNTDYAHGYLTYNWLNQFKLDKRIKETIKNGVRYHMFPWCYIISPFEDRNYTNKEMKVNLEEYQRASYPSRIELAVREADYWASRKNMSFLPGVNALHDMPEEEKE